MSSLTGPEVVSAGHWVCLPWFGRATKRPVSHDHPEYMMLCHEGWYSSVLDHVVIQPYSHMPLCCQTRCMSRRQIIWSCSQERGPVAVIFGMISSTHRRLPEDKLCSAHHMHSRVFGLKRHICSRFCQSDWLRSLSHLEITPFLA